MRAVFLRRKTAPVSGVDLPDIFVAGLPDVFVAGLPDVFVAGDPGGTNRRDEPSRIQKHFP